MKNKQLQYILLILIFFVIFTVYMNTNNTAVNNTTVELNVDTKKDNSYNYSNTNTIITDNSNNSTRNTNIVTNANNFKSNNLDNIIVKEEHIYIDLKYILNDNAKLNVYTKGTIPENLDSLLVYHIKYIIRKSIKQEYFNISDLERVYEEIDEFNNRRYVIIFFIYNLNYFNSNKLIIDFVVNFQTNFIYLNDLREFNNSYPNLVNYYDDLVFNRGYLKEVNPKDDLNEIIKEDYKKNYNYSYLSTSSLDFSNIYLIESDIKSLKDFSTIYLPKEQTQIKSNIFCDKYQQEWNQYGVLLMHKNIPKECILHNSSTSDNLDVPQKYPFFGDYRDSNYNWLIDYKRNNIIRQHGYTI